MDVSKIPESIRTFEPEENNARGDAELEQEDFLELMTVQLQTQDPFAPQGTEKMMEQMTQFGMVEAIQDMSKQFSTVAQQMASSELLQSVSLLDRNVMIDSPQTYLGEEGGIEGIMELDSGSSGVTLTVSDAAGQLVKKFELGPQSAGSLDFTWDGLDEAGKQMPAGIYKVQALATNQDGTTALPIWLSARVSSVTPGSAGGSTLLGLKGMDAINLDDVKKVQ